MNETPSNVELDVQIASLERSIEEAEAAAERHMRDFGSAHSINDLVISLKNRLRTAKKARAEMQ